MLPILAGIETEYGLTVEDVDPSALVRESTEFVRTCPVGRRGWDYRCEFPRADLRGFTVEKLTVDPVDAKFDETAPIPPDADIRSDFVLPNGARFYNDHGHPEYATPECFGIDELARHDLAGAMFLHQMAQGYAAKTGKSVRLYKNNTDYHGASYGTHESYLVPRSVGFDPVVRWLTPLLAVRGFLCGAGKAGTEQGSGPAFQLTQRADFFSTPIGVDTLYNRPVFNTRDEPHADSAQWMRIHVISGDANPTFGATARKVALVKMALQMAILGLQPIFELKDPVRAFREASQDPSGDVRIELASGSWTTPRSILDAYLGAGCMAVGSSDPELGRWIQDCIDLLDAFDNDTGLFVSEVEWAAKKVVLDEFAETGDVSWGSPEMQAYDLAFHEVDPEENLYHALVADGRFAPQPDPDGLTQLVSEHMERTRSWVRGLAVAKFPEAIQTVGWRYLAMAGVQFDLLPDTTYPPQLAACQDVESFIEALHKAGVPCQTID